MFRQGKRYFFGISAAKNHLLVAPFNSDVLDALEDRLVGLKRNKKLFRCQTIGTLTQTYSPKW